MAQEASVTRVVFRMDRQDGGVFALLPDDRATAEGHCTAYQRVGGHCPADYAGCIARSRLARPEEYADLKAEMERIGYVLAVLHRR